MAWETTTWVKISCAVSLDWLLLCFPVAAEKPRLQRWQEISPNVLA